MYRDMIHSFKLLLGRIQPNITHNCLVLMLVSGLKINYFELQCTLPLKNNVSQFILKTYQIAMTFMISHYCNSA